jgi:hypothetical protein
MFVGFTLSAGNKGTFREMIDQVTQENPGHASGRLPHERRARLRALLREHRHERPDGRPARRPAHYRGMRSHKYTPIGFLEDQYLRLADQCLQTGETPVTCQALAGSVFIDSFGSIYRCSIYSKRMANIKDIDNDLEFARGPRGLGGDRAGECPQG